MIRSRAADPALAELFKETRSSVPGLTSMLKDETPQWQETFEQVYRETVSGEAQAVQSLPAQIDPRQATLECLEGGLVAGSFGVILSVLQRSEVAAIVDQARAVANPEERLAQHQARCEELLAAPARETLHESFLEGVWVGALESALHLGPR